MKSKIFIPLLVLLLIIPFVSSWNTNSFTNGLASENITIFYDSDNNTRYISIPDTVGFISNAKFNITTLEGYIYNDTQNSFECNAGDWDAVQVCSNIYDDNWATYGWSKLNFIAQTNITYYAINYSTSKSKWEVKDNWGTTSLNFNRTCWNQVSSDYFKLTTYSYRGLFGNRVTWGCGTNEALELRDNAGIDGYIYEETMNWSYGNLTNPNITLNNNQIWAYDGYFNTNNFTSSFSSYVTNYLATCIYSGGFCNVPINFTSSSAGNFVYFDLEVTNEGFLENSQTYDNTSVEYSLEEFKINISYDDLYYTSITPMFFYNGTQYTPTNEGNNIYSEELTLPAVNTDTNISFYWTFAMYNGTATEYYNSSTYNQTVKNISLGDCSSALQNITILNYTLYDEDTLAYSTTANASIDVKVLVGNSDLSGYIEYAQNTTEKIEVLVCSNINISKTRLDAEAKYSSQDRVVEYYNIQNYTVENDELPIKVYLYDLPILSSQEFLITFKNNFFIPVEDVIINISRQYIGQGGFKTIEVPKTDADGNTIAHLVLGDEIYTFEVFKNGQLLATYENVRAFCDNILTGDCKIELIQSLDTDDIDNPQFYGDVSLSGNYDDSTRTYTINFNAIDGLPKVVNLSVYSFGSVETAFCSSQVTSTSSSLNCVVPESAGNGTAIAKVFVDGEQIAQDIFRLKTSLRDEFGNTRYLIAFMLILTLPLLAFTSGTFMLILFLVGLAIASLLFLVDVGGLVGMTSVFIWFVVSAGILIWKIRRTDN